MDGISVAASVIAVVDVSVKVITLCSQYSKAVAGAAADISRLETQVKGLKTTLDGAKALIEAPQGASLSTSHDLKDQLAQCQDILAKLLDQLETAARKTKRRPWLRALKWPFSREETEANISTLERCHRQIMDGLQIDQTTLLLHIKNGVDNIPTNEDVTTAQRPHFLIPFPRDPDFVARPAIQTQIHKQLKGTTSRIALIGMGGFGKSQIAIEIAHSIHSSNPEKSVFWVFGASQATLEESYRALADKLALPRRHDLKTNILALVRDWLQRDDVAPWLMILDNADTFDAYFGGTKDFPIASYLPKGSNGKILITSRYLNVAERLTGNNKAIIKIPAMSNNEALSLLQEKLSSSYDEAAATKLIHCLDFIPLAINQAAAYINRRHISISIYMERFEDSDKKRIGLLRHDGGDIRRHENVSNSVLATWQVTFDQILQENPTAADLLSLLSCFQPHNIPQHMLSGYSESLHNSKSSKDDGEILEDDMDVLCAYSLVHVSTEPHLYEMHSLVQVCTQAWLSELGGIARWEKLFLQLASEHFPGGHFETWRECQLLLPHIDRMLDEQPHDEADTLVWALLLTNVSWYLLEKGAYNRAMALVQKSLWARKNLLGAGHPDTLTSMANLASTFGKQGRWEEAEKLEVQVMETRKTKLGADHPNTLISMGNLASTYSNQGRWGEAEKLEVQVMETRKIKLGADHPDTLISMANLASTYRNQGRWEEAEKLEVQVMETRKIKFGADHPDTLISMGNLALTYSNQGRWEEAEKLEVQVMETRKIKLGADHPDTLISMGNLALTYSNQGRWEEAEKLNIQVMETSKTKLGADHPSTLTSIADLALTYWNQGRWGEAEKLNIQVMETRKMKLGADHPDTLISMGNLASTYSSQGRWEEAEKLEVQVMETRKIKLGADHPDTLMSMGNLASTYSSQGRWEEAEKLEVQVMETRKTKLGADHPNTLISMGNLASIYSSQGRWGEAEKLEVQVMETRKTKLGADHPYTLISMANLAYTLRSLGRLQEALDLMDKCASHSQRILGLEHPDTQSSRETMELWRQSDE